VSEEIQSIESLDFEGDLTKLPTSKELPVGLVELEIKAITTGKTKPNTSGETYPADHKTKAGKPKVGEKVFVNVQVMVTDHPNQLPYRGRTGFHRFYIGSDTDPSAKSQATWKTNATDLMRMLKKAKVAMSPTTKISDALKASVGNKFIGENKVEVDKSGKYPDKVVIRNFWAVGEKEVSVVDDGGVAEFSGEAAPAPQSTFTETD
jgi:hypothetical protein